MHLVLAALLAVSPDGGVGAELTVYRSPEEVPASWRALLPKDFDFRTQQLATSARPGQPVELVVPRVDRTGVDLIVTPPPEFAGPSRCPPCRGINAPPDLDELMGPVSARVVRPFLYALPRGSGKVFELPRVRLEAPPCPPCYAP
jgi:hypothetical protein